MRKWWAVVLTIGSVASADGLVTIEPGYRLRRGHGYSFGWDTVIRRATKAQVVAVKGSWRKVCIGGASDGCVGGRTGWIYKDGIRLNASEEVNTAAGCAYGRCPPRPGRVEQSIQGMADAISDDPQKYQLTGAFRPGCSRFITPAGLGNWGRLVTRVAQQRARSCFYETNIFGDMCPNYLSLSPAKKNAMIAMMFAAIGETEAVGCTPSAINVEAYNDQADGMFQMEHTASQRRDAGRDAQACETHNPRANTFSPVFQTNCAVSIIRDTICKGRGPKHIHRYRHNYFAQLKGEGDITRRIRETGRQWRICQ